MPSFQRGDAGITLRPGPGGAGWTDLPTTLQPALDAARAAGLPVLLQPGAYRTGPLALVTERGQGAAAALQGPTLQAVPGTVVLQAAGPGGLLRIEGGGTARIIGLAFDGRGQAPGGSDPARAALVSVRGGRVTLSDCGFVDAPAAGVHGAAGSAVIVERCRFADLAVAVFSEDSILTARHNVIAGMADNGIAVYRSRVAHDGASITDNVITDIGASKGGTGPYGNGISTFRAVGVTIRGNRIARCRFSAIRCNGGGQITIADNTASAIREVALYVEAPDRGIDLTGAVVTGNVVDEAGIGISIANAGAFNDGVTRSVIVSGNRLSNLRNNPIPDPGYVPPTTIGVGIWVSQDCSVVGNIVDGAARVGIQAGTGPVFRDLIVSGNSVRGAPIGIGIAADALTTNGRNLVVSGNVVQGAQEGAIVPTLFTGTTLTRVAGRDLADGRGDTVGSVSAALNTAR